MCMPVSREAKYVCAAPNVMLGRRASRGCVLLHFIHCSVLGVRFSIGNVHCEPVVPWACICPNRAPSWAPVSRVALAPEGLAICPAAIIVLSVCVKNLLDLSSVCSLKELLSSYFSRPVLDYRNCSSSVSWSLPKGSFLRAFTLRTRV